MSDDTSNKVPEEIKVQIQMHSYLDRAIGYYIFARNAIRLGVVPVGGSMFHTAVEMVLRCGLSYKYTQFDLSKMESTRWHNIPDMWSEFKSIFPNKILERFDVFIIHYQQWKEQKYPEGVSTIFFGPTKPDTEKMKTNIANLPLSKNYIEINLEEMDEFMTSVIQTINIDPNFIKIYLQRSEELIDLYLKENSHPLFDESQVNSATFFKK